jgi:hypothetical protein
MQENNENYVDGNKIKKFDMILGIGTVIFIKFIFSKN